MSDELNRECLAGPFALEDVTGPKENHPIPVAEVHLVSFEPVLKDTLLVHAQVAL